MPLLQALTAQLPAAQLPGDLRVVDSTFFRMGARLWARCGRPLQPREAAGVKLGLMLEPQSMCPTAAVGHVGMGSDTSLWPQLLATEPPTPGHIYLFDRGLRDYSVFNELLAAGAHFITRAYQRQLRLQVVQALPLAADAPHVLADRLVRAGRPQRPVQGVIRPLTVQTAEHGRVSFLTSLLDRPAAEVAELYRRRWQIEVFFRWLKSTLGLIRPLAYSQQAAEHTIYAALVAYLLMLLLAPEELTVSNTGRLRGVKMAVEAVRMVLEDNVARRFAKQIRRLTRL